MKKRSIKTIALGGMFIAIFISINYIFQLNIRSMQMLLNIIRIVCMAYYTNIKGMKNGIVMSVAALLCSAILLPLHYVAIYILPCTIVGIIYGSTFEIKKNMRMLLTGTFLQMLFYAYYIWSFFVFMKVNLLDIYLETFRESIELYARYISIAFIETDTLAWEMVIVSTLTECIMFAVLINMIMKKFVRIKIYGSEE